MANNAGGGKGLYFIVGALVVARFSYWYRWCRYRSWNEL